MRTLLITLSGVLTIAAVVPYLIEIVRGKTKPRIVSWFTWSLLTGIACAATFSDGQTASGILLLCATIEVLLVVVFGLKHGDRKIERLDIICQAAALAGLALWLIFNSPAVAVIATVIIDLIGSIPTIKHSWLRPYEETWITFGLCSLGAACTLLAITEWSVTAVAYPLYIVVVNVVMAMIILLSPRRKKRSGVAAQPREL